MRTVIICFRDEYNQDKNVFRHCEKAFGSMKKLYDHFIDEGYSIPSAGDHWARRSGSWKTRNSVPYQTFYKQLKGLSMGFTVWKDSHESKWMCYKLELI